jgi:hypothetical protein
MLFCPTDRDTDLAPICASSFSRFELQPYLGLRLTLSKLKMLHAMFNFRWLPKNFAVTPCFFLKWSLNDA